MVIYDKFNRLEKDKWYSVGDIVELTGYSSLVEKKILLQNYFWSILVLLATNCFSDAKTENISESS